MSKKKPPLKALPARGVIEVRGVRQNNLKGIDLDIPLGKLNVISGPSGSGKSSLAFDTIYAEGQRRYVETFSPYTRQFLDRMDKPKVDSIRGIPPAIAIQQANSVKSTRSTVGTMTEINDYLKVLMPRIVEGFCPSCDRQIRPESATSIAEHAFAELAGESVLITFDVPAPPKTKPAEFFQFLQAQGYVRVWLEGKVQRTDAPAEVKRLPALVPVIQDRVTVSEENRSRLSEAVETALRFGKGRLSLYQLSAINHQHPFSTGWHCAHCDIEIQAPTPGLFSFNHPLGACPECKGFGRVIGIDLQRAVPDRRLCLMDRAVKPFQGERGEQCQKDLMKFAEREGIDVLASFDDLSKKEQDWVLRGEDPKASGIELWENDRWYGVRGFFQWLETKAYKMHVRVFLARYRSYTACPACNGGRYQPGTLNFRAGGMTLPELMQMPVGRLADHIRSFRERMQTDPTAQMLHGEVEARLRYLVEVGLGYLTVDRPTKTLSGGEVERVNLTACLGASLVNTLFVLDEPSVGLHPRDVGRLIQVMKELRDKGNTLVVVEHEEAVLRSADHMIEIGPGRGEAGGELVYEGTLPGLLDKKRANSLTADYLTGRKSIAIPQQRRKAKHWIRINQASQNNLKNVDVELPLGVLACVTGVSGSGKSTLIHEVLYRYLQQSRGEALDEEPGRCRGISGTHKIDEVIMVDQSPLARSPRSSPALYLGVFDSIREMFALTPEASQQGMTASTFSFNSGNGRCERCNGMGFEKIEMQFLSDLFVRCAECEGKRYQDQVLAVKVEGKSIHDVLELTVDAAILFFEKRGMKKVVGPLKVLQEVGLGYLGLGQPLNVLSGGESQRLKLVSHLTGKARENNLLIFDEPTTGLHFDDVAMLLKAFERLVKQGNSLIVIEHNLEVIKCADWVVDLGPEAGDEGGEVVAAGTPEEVAAVEGTHTGRYLRSVLGRVGVSPAGSGVSPGPSLYNVAEEHYEALRVAEEASGGTPTRSGESIADGICIHGAREHNLKDISLTIPRDQLVVVTGLSGSGKSTLAFDIVFAEGQRRFLDSMSPYARQFMEQLEKPEVDLITGLPPTVAIEQRVTRGGGKSTVATVTEVYHFMRLLFAKAGTQYCPKCDLPVEAQTVAEVTKRAVALAEKGTVRVLAPLVKARKGFHTEVAKWAERNGYETLLVDGKFMPVAGFQKLERFREHTIDVVVGETSDAAEIRKLVTRALKIGRGTARLLDAKNASVILSTERSCPGCGAAFEELDPRIFSYNSPHGWCPECRGFGEVWKIYENPRAETELEREIDAERQHGWLDPDSAKPCPTCHGARINETAQHVRIADTSIDMLAACSVKTAADFLGSLKLEGRQKLIADDLLIEIGQRLRFMTTVGLDYLALDRSAKTLSGGESQRIRLAAQLGSNLSGVLYVLDEPTIGLHPRDNLQLLDTLEALKTKGNSLLVVEHDEDTMQRADVIIDLGPGAGMHGGEVVAQGTLPEIRRVKNSATARCLNQPMPHPSRGERRPLGEVKDWIEVKGARANNLQSVDARIPLGRLTVVSGISGSGKSSLMRGVVRPAVTEALTTRPRKRKTKKEQPWDAVLGAKALEAVYEVDQSPIGKTSRSTPATYIKVFDEIRKVFAQIPLARMRGYTASRFSFNAEGGRCETCKGQGVIKIEMNFLPASYLPCSDCHGKRYNTATLEVEYDGKSIGDVMEMTLEQAADFFQPHPKIRRPLGLLVDTGLGYLKLGQPSPTLSGGEAQRLKLVSELTRGVGRDENTRMKRGISKSILYLLEEPTIGLHMADVERLLDVFHRLVDEGHTVVVIEHNLTVIADADYVIDIGPEAGNAGGRLVADGTPEEVAQSKESRTAPFLREVLGSKALKATVHKKRKPALQRA